MNVSREKVQVDISSGPASVVVEAGPCSIHGEMMESNGEQRLSANEIPNYGCQRDNRQGGDNQNGNTPGQEGIVGALPAVHRTTSFSVLDILDPNKFNSKQRLCSVAYKPNTDYIIRGEDKQDQGTELAHQKPCLEDFDNCKKSADVLRLIIVPRNSVPILGYRTCSFRIAWSSIPLTWRRSIPIVCDSYMCISEALGSHQLVACAFQMVSTHFVHLLTCGCGIQCVGRDGKKGHS
ncbi:NK1 transcription factor-related 1 [Pelobates cultripes]|uniref:NK1 transcription factor-related 1 n=1 Tax=Pelobates cultripes TaxID=61616 RepID=A0AAD1SDR3_PELCU|nr:NK1 transcription factor-related 1 [Pelobates cultripes]